MHRQQRKVPRLEPLGHHRQLPRAKLRPGLAPSLRHQRGNGGGIAARPERRRPGLRQHGRVHRTPARQIAPAHQARPRPGRPPLQPRPVARDKGRHRRNHLPPVRAHRPAIHHGDPIRAEHRLPSPDQRLQVQPVRHPEHLAMARRLRRFVRPVGGRPLHPIRAGPRQRNLALQRCGPPILHGMDVMPRQKPRLFIHAQDDRHILRHSAQQIPQPLQFRLPRQGGQMRRTQQHRPRLGVPLCRRHQIIPHGLRQTRLRLGRAKAARHAQRVRPIRVRHRHVQPRVRPLPPKARHQHPTRQQRLAPIEEIGLQIVQPAMRQTDEHSDAHRRDQSAGSMAGNGTAQERQAKTTRTLKTPTMTHPFCVPQNRNPRKFADSAVRPPAIRAATPGASAGSTCPIPTRASVIRHRRTGDLTALTARTGLHRPTARGPAGRAGTASRRPQGTCPS